MKFVTFTIFVIIAVAITASQGQEATCSPWLKQCHVYEDCCRHLICSTYTSTCVAQPGLIVPGEDKRPLGPGPYSPNVPKNELPN